MGVTCGKAASYMILASCDNPRAQASAPALSAKAVVGSIRIAANVNARIIFCYSFVVFDCLVDLLQMSADPTYN